MHPENNKGGTPMKKLLAVLLTVALMASLLSFAGAEDYTIRIYSNSNSPERTTWLIEKAKEAGFTISIDDNTVISGDTAAVQAANEKKDGDLIFGLNETRWSQLINGADVVDSGYTWYRQGKVGGTTNMNINNAMLYPFVDPESPAGGISVEGWKTLWKYCANGNFTGDKYGLDPLIRGDVQVSTFYSSSLYGNIDAAAEDPNYPNPLKGTINPENWNLVDIDDGTYYIAEYLGVLDKEGRTDEQTEIVKAFAEWFGSAETQAAWSEEFDSYPCNSEAVKLAGYEEVPAIYAIKNFALEKVGGTDMTYAEYVTAHSAEWTNIMTNLGFYWADNADAPAEPDWDNLDWATLTQAAAE